LCAWTYTPKITRWPLITGGPSGNYTTQGDINEAVLALLTGDPAVLTGRDVSSIELLVELQRPVYDFSGTTLVDGWQPADLPAFIEARKVPVPLSYEGQSRGSRP
jgi:hypothetical protein